MSHRLQANKLLTIRVEKPKILFILGNLEIQFTPRSVKLLISASILHFFQGNKAPHLVVAPG